MGTTPPASRSIEALDAALDVAIIVVENGGPTARADRTFANVYKGLMDQSAIALWRTDFVVATAAVGGESSTRFRHIGPLGVNLLRVAEASALAERVAGGNINLTEVVSETLRIKSITPPYGLALTVGAAAFASAVFSRFIGGDWGSFVICFVAGGAGQWLRAILHRLKLPAPAISISCATASALIAAGGLRAHASTVLAATLIGSVAYMIPGLPLVNGFIDIGSADYLSVGAQRILSAIVIFFLIAIGLAIGAAAA